LKLLHFIPLWELDVRRKQFSPKPLSFLPLISLFQGENGEKDIDYTSEMPSGGLGVVGSNPAAPTTKQVRRRETGRRAFAFPGVVGGEKIWFKRGSFEDKLNLQHLLPVSSGGKVGKDACSLAIVRSGCPRPF